MKPLGYYCNYTPGDGGLLGEMEESWGSYFEEINNSERLWFLFRLFGTMTANAGENYNPYEVQEVISPACDRLNELSIWDQLGLASALIDQIKANR
ncbi:MAG: hypothetical protein KME31_08555 [Tolypothrix carrinoi HA7290-LM1]|jgi:hypothetical protein|nr:hypothetical protein [Tolypothrix carrinoi HA7290-LM1]